MLAHYPTKNSAMNQHEKLCSPTSPASPSQDGNAKAGKHPPCRYNLPRGNFLIISWSMELSSMSAQHTHTPRRALDNVKARWQCPMCERTCSVICLDAMSIVRCRHNFPRPRQRVVSLAVDAGTTRTTAHALAAKATLSRLFLQ